MLTDDGLVTPDVSVGAPHVFGATGLDVEVAHWRPGLVHASEGQPPTSGLTEKKQAAKLLKDPYFTKKK